jgi:hypothetical protein
VSRASGDARRDAARTPPAQEGEVVTRITELARAAALVYATYVTAAVSTAGAPAGGQATSPDAPAQAAPGKAAQPVPSALTGATTAHPAADGWHWEVQRLGRRVIRVMPQR